jgi:hypothetical protein
MQSSLLKTDKSTPSTTTNFISPSNTCYIFVDGTNKICFGWWYTIINFQYNAQDEFYKNKVIYLKNQNTGIINYCTF